MSTSIYHRETGDIGNAVALEHLNLQVEDQGLATTFYVTGLGLTRDPYMMTGIKVMWINAGRNQFHLITGKPQVVSGHIGLVVPDLQALLQRLDAVRPLLAGTRFAFEQCDNFVAVTCPWGNRFRCHAPDPVFGQITLGLPYIEFDVPPGTAQGIADFYRQVIQARATVDTDATCVTARVLIGLDQELRFRETCAPIAPFDGHHIQIYVVNFSAPHHQLIQRKLVTEESNEHQYRFDTIVDPADGRPLTKIEHEVRSLRHPLYGRPLVNRNPAQSNINYAPGHDAWIPGSVPRKTDNSR